MPDFSARRRHLRPPPKKQHRGTPPSRPARFLHALNLSPTTTGKAPSDWKYRNRGEPLAVFAWETTGSAGSCLAASRPQPSAAPPAKVERSPSATLDWGVIEASPFSHVYYELDLFSSPLNYKIKLIGLERRIGSASECMENEKFKTKKSDLSWKHTILYMDLIPPNREQNPDRKKK